MNHSLISASGHTHAKIAALAVAASLVFMAVVSASGVGSDGARTTVVKATTIMNIAKGDGALVR
jgi:hypothetical protein